jgi:hypothetical protein
MNRGAQPWPAALAPADLDVADLYQLAAALGA